MNLQLGTLAEWCGGQLGGGQNGQMLVQGVGTDSRADLHGRLFIALKGDNFDGHQFLDAAFANGAVAALVSDGSLLKERPGIVVRDTLHALGDLAHRYRWSGRLIPWVGVTGTNGKSTTRHMITHVLSTRGGVCSPQKNFNNLIGMPLTILSNVESNNYGVLELGTSAPGEIARLTEIATPTVSVITNIGPAHLEGLGSVEGVAREKAAIFSRLPQDGLGIYPSQAEYVNILAEQVRVRRATFAVEAHADMVATDVQTGAEGSRFVVRGTPFRLPLLGRHNISNCLAALLALEFLGVSLPEAAAALETIQPMPERLQQVTTPYCVILDDCYNANPASFHAAVRAMMEIPAPRHIAIVGDMLELGEGSAALHTEMGRWLAHMGADMILAVGKDALALAESAHAQNARQVVKHFRSVQSLLGHLPTLIKEGDVVLVKGSRGMRLERVVKSLELLGAGAQAAASEPL